MEALLADHARDQARDAHLGGAAYEKSIEHFLEDRAIRGSRQMEEHYHRERSPDAGRLRNHLAAAITSGDLAQLASGLASGAGRRALTAKSGPKRPG